ncbi:AI-2E family transporter [Gemmatimonas sp.]|jgi:predicted PurR-regulated permease PerM|uniref:AI-2E family transporter n=1 Tax=Gemmatimonas sp. TaxID=1962908 RepID=UPI0022BA8653|nr:AI-2E family transporter [Gemmatimonas sp.]MCZ8203085.1 AI-2E family transporter [Gemmatimonas sp.]
MTNNDETLLPDPLPPERRGWRTADLTRAALTVLAVWFGLQLLWSVRSLAILVFLATLFGVAVARGVDYLERFRLRRGIASALIVLGTLGAIGGVLALTAPTLVEQGRQLQQEFPAAVTKVQTWIDSKRGGLLGSLISTAAGTGTGTGTTVDSLAVVAPPGGAPMVGVAGPAGATTGGSVAPTTGAGAPAAANASGPAATESPTDAIKRRLSDGLGSVSKYLFSFVSNTLAAITAFVLLIFLAMYIGAEPDVYRGWMLAMVPATSRAQTRVVLAEISKVLRKWLVTQLVAMAVIGTVSYVVLLLLGVKAAFALGFIAGLLEFIPTVGPLLSAIPAVLMGFVDSPEKALAVAIAYWGIQFVENNLLIPFLMRGEMDLPPAITIVAQTLMTLVFGFLGLMVAVPLTAAVLVPLRMMAERENAREKLLVRSSKARQDLMRAEIKPEVVMGEADRGPMVEAGDAPRAPVSPP